MSYPQSFINHSGIIIFPILTGFISGILIHTALILALCLLLPFNGDLFATLYPKSITTAIEMGEV